MSFWSSLLFARVAPAPVVTVADLGEFTRRVAASEALVGGVQLLCQIKYGDLVDADEDTTDVVEWDESGTIGTVGEYAWDRSESFASLSAMADALVNDRETIYRAFLQFGQMNSKIVTALTRATSEENEVGLCLCDLSLTVGPVHVAGLASDSSAFVGWMGLSFSGPGYYHPWTFRSARERAEANELVVRLMNACRATWPVKGEAPSAAAVDARREMGELWLYDDLELPHDWLWFATESG